VRPSLFASEGSLCAKMAQFLTTSLRFNFATPPQAVASNFFLRLNGAIRPILPWAHGSVVPPIILSPLLELTRRLLDQRVSCSALTPLVASTQQLYPDQNGA